MKIFSILIFSIVFFMACNKHSSNSVKPFIINRVSEDSILVKFSYDDYQKRLEKTNRYKRILLADKYDVSIQENDDRLLFNRVLSEIRLHHETDYLGINIFDAELKELLFGKIVHKSIESMPIFKNPKTQKFDRNRLLFFIDRIKKEKISDPFFTWQYHVDELREKVLREKYEALLNASYIQTDVERSLYNKLVLGKSTIQVGFIPYSSFIDTLELTENDFHEYLELNSYNYQSQEERFLKTVEVPIKIYKHFHEKEFKSLSRYLETFDDLSQIAVQNENVKQFSSYYTSKSVPENLASFFENGEVGDRFGPYFEKNSFRVIKIDNKGASPDEVKAQHLVIKGIDKPAIEKIKQEIESRLDKGEDFMDLAKEYTEPYDFDGKYGDAGWFRYAQMLKPFSDAAFFNAPKQLVLAKTKYGWHIINIQEHRNISQKYSFTALYWPLQVVEEDIKSSIVTAENFANSIEEPTQFINKAMDNKFIVSDAIANSLNVELDEMKNTREVFQWAFNSAEGSISKPYFINGRIYVFMIEEVSPPGLMSLKSAREFIRTGVQEEVLKKTLGKRFHFDELNKKNFDESAKALNMKVVNVAGVGFQQDEVPNIGRDNFTIALASIMKSGDVSKIYFGDKGVFQIKKLSEKNIVASEEYSNIKKNAWALNLSNNRYELVFTLNDHLKINKVRKQDSYLLLPKYDDELVDNEEYAGAMFFAEHAFREGDFKKALYGSNQFKGFEVLTDELTLSKQKRLSLLYAGLSALQLKEYQKAIDFMKLVKTNDRFFSAISKGVQGDCFVQLNNLSQAIQKYEEAIKASSNFLTNGVYLFKLAAIANHMGDHAKAYEYISIIKKDYPQSYLMSDVKKLSAVFGYYANKESYVRKVDF